MKTVQTYFVILVSITVITCVSFMLSINSKQSHKLVHEYNIPKVIANNSCIVDSWLHIDVSAKTLKRHLFCDDVAERSDILCRWYLDQQNVTNHNECLIPQDNYKVPNIVFYITFGSYNFTVIHYMCILSAHKIQNPRAIYIIGDEQPHNQWWKKLNEDVPQIRFIYRKRPTSILGTTINWAAHASDIVRLQILLANGGIYMDTDEIFVNSVNPLRNYPLTMGLVDDNTGMGNAVIITQRRSTFLQKIYDNYNSFNGKEYYENSLQAGLKLWKKNRTEVHLESNKFYRPGWYEDDKLFTACDYKWRKKYAIHLWYRKNIHRMIKTLNEVDTLNTTMAEVFRYVYYGDSKIRSIP